MFLGRLLNFVFGQVAVRFGEFCQFHLVVAVGVRHFERANSILRVRLDIGDTINLLQIASDRGGAATSRHVGNFEADQGKIGRRRIARTRFGGWSCGVRNGCRRVGCRTATKPSGGQPKGCYQSQSLLHFHSPERVVVNTRIRPKNRRRLELSTAFGMETTRNLRPSLIGFLPVCLPHGRHKVVCFLFLLPPAVDIIKVGRVTPAADHAGQTCS